MHVDAKTIALISCLICSCGGNSGPAHDDLSSTQTDETVDTGSENPPPAENPPELPPVPPVEPPPEEPPAEPPPSSSCGPAVNIGAVTCTCNSLDAAAWLSSGPKQWNASIDFGETGFVAGSLSASAALVLADHEEGNSANALALSFDILSRCESASLLKTESQIAYLDAGGEKIDTLVSIDGQKVGVRTTRAFKFPVGTPCVDSEITNMLNSKLWDLSLAESNVEASEAWDRSLLHVIAVDSQCAQMVVDRWKALDSVFRSDIYLVVSTTNGADTLLY